MCLMMFPRSVSFENKLDSKKNPRDIEAPGKIYASSVTTRKIVLDELSKTIARSSNIGKG